MRSKVKCDALNESLELLWNQTIGILQELLPNFETLYGAIELDDPEKEEEVKKIVGDQLSIIIKSFLEAFSRQRAYWTLREAIKDCDLEQVQHPPVAP